MTAAMIQKWNYKLIRAGRRAGTEEALNSLQNDLNGAGREGWEAVSTIHFGLAGNIDDVVILRKRPAAKARGDGEEM